MKKIEIETIEKYISHYFCDNCNKQNDCIPVGVYFGYGSIYDMDELHFCCDKCFKEYIINKFKTE